MLTLALGALIGMAALAGVGRATAVTARHRIQSTADLSALAGATRAIEGRVAACGAAARIAESNHAALTRCDLSGEIIEVQVSGRLTIGRLGSWAVTGAARAGPA